MKIVAASVALSLTLLTPLFGAPPPAKWQPNDWVEFLGEAVECVVDYGLETAAATAKVEASSIPLTDIYSALMALPDVTQEAIRRRLQVRMESMALQDDPASLKKLNLLQAYYTALAAGDNSRLLELQAQHEAARNCVPSEGTGGSPPPSDQPGSYSDPRTKDGYYVDRCYSFGSGCDDNDNPDYKPSADAFCKSKGHAGVASGGSHWSFKAPTQIQADGQLCKDPKGCGGLDWVTCK